MVEANPEADNSRKKRAYEVERPLFENGNNWEFNALKASLLERAPNVHQLPDLKFLNGMSMT